VNNGCYRVGISSDGQHITSTHRFGSNCSTQRINYQAAILGGIEEPNEQNGWELIYVPGQMLNHPNEFILRDRFYGGSYWRAYLTGNVEAYGTTAYDGWGWKAEKIGNEAQMIGYAGQLAVLHTPEEVTVAQSETFRPDFTQYQNKSIEKTAAIASALIVLLIIVWNA
jgi:hypothetical protein